MEINFWGCIILSFSFSKINFIMQWISTIVLIFTLSIMYREFRRNIKNRKQDLYAKLELTSMELFKLEIEYPELTKIYYREAEKNLPASVNFDVLDDEYKRLYGYIASLLNLFEIHYVLRKTNEINPEIFASWMPWLFDVLASPYFRWAWQDLKKHYIRGLRKFIDNLIRIIERGGDEKKLYQEASKEFENDVIIKNWWRENSG